jgi:phage tail sheath gpL-like
MTTSTAVSVGTVARVTGIEFIPRDLSGGAAKFLPQQVGIVGQGADATTYASTRVQLTSANQAGTTYGYGSPIHLAAMQLLPANGDGVGIVPVWAYPLQADGSGVAAAGDILPAGTGTASASFKIVCNNIESAEFVVPAASSASAVITLMIAAVDAKPEFPMIATDGTTTCTFTSKWAGVSSNALSLSVLTTSTSAYGNTFTVTQPTGGLVNPDVDDALNAIGSNWISLVLNCMESDDTASLTKFNTWGEGRWNSLVNKQAVVFTGDVQSTVAGAITVPDARKTDRINCQLVSPGSSDLPFVVAARQLARIAKLANDDPAFDYGGRKATGLTPGADSVQWTHTQRQQAILGGSSTIEVQDSVVELSDTITMYHPTGEDPPMYRYVVDIVKLMQVSYGLQLIFKRDDWNGAPLVPNDQIISSPTAKKPYMAVADISSMIDGLAREAVLSDPETAKSTIVANINETDPKRLDVSFTIQLSGNTNIKSLTVYWGFYFGA